MVEEEAFKVGWRGKLAGRQGGEVLDEPELRNALRTSCKTQRERTHVVDARPVAVRKVPASDYDAKEFVMNEHHDPRVDVPKSEGIARSVVWSILFAVGGSETIDELHVNLGLLDDEDLHSEKASAPAKHIPEGETRTGT